MKKLIAFLLLLAVSAASFGQPTTTTTPPVKTNYLKKSKSQKSTAWSLLIGGTVVFALTGLNSEGPIGQKTTFHAVPGILGAAMMISSIPLFIAFGKNKRKSNAMSASIKMENVNVIQGYSMVHTSYPVLSLKICLR